MSLGTLARVALIEMCNNVPQKIRAETTMRVLRAIPTSSSITQIDEYRLARDKHRLEEAKRKAEDNIVIEEEREASYSGFMKDCILDLKDAIDNEDYLDSTKEVIKEIEKKKKKMTKKEKNIERKKQEVLHKKAEVSLNSIINKQIKKMKKGSKIKI